MRSKALTGMKAYGPALSVYKSARALLPLSQAFEPSTALVMGQGGLTVNASKGADLKPRVEIWRDRTDTSPKMINGGPGAALAPDGHSLAFVVDKTEIKIIDLTDKQKPVGLKGAGSPISTLVYCRDGQWIASASEDRRIRVWNVADGKLVYTFEGHEMAITGLAYSPSDDLLASCSADQTVRLWDLKQGNCRRTLTGYEAAINSVAFAPQGRLLASGSADKLIKLWDCSTGAEIGTISGNSAEVTSLAFSKDGRMLASGSADPTWPLWPGQIKLWNTVSECLHHDIWRPPTNGVYRSWPSTRIAGRLVSAGADFQVRSWDVSSYSTDVIAVKK